MKTNVFSITTLAALLLAAGAAGAQPAAAQDAAGTVKAVRAKLPKAKPAIKKIVIDNDDVDPDGDEPDVTNSAVADFDCELGNKLTVYKNGADENNIALRWKQRVHRLTRVSTTTGAQRFENAANGLTWITIPAKGLLLHGKKGRQLANECVLKRAIEVKTDAPQPPAAPAVTAPEGKAPDGAVAGKVQAPAAPVTGA